MLMVSRTINKLVALDVAAAGARCLVPGREGEEGGGKRERKREGRGGEWRGGRGRKVGEGMGRGKWEKQEERGKKKGGERRIRGGGGEER